MNQDLQGIVNRLAEAKEQRGRLTQIAAGSGVSYRTIYSLLHAAAPVASAATVDKLLAYFKKADKRAAKEVA